MSKLVKSSINDTKSTNKNGLVESNFEDQIQGIRVPAIYVDISESDIYGISINSGILRIYNDFSTYTDYNVFSKPLAEICNVLRDNIPNSTAHLLSKNIGFATGIQLTSFTSSQIFNINIDKSPLQLSDFHPDCLENVILLDEDTAKYSVINVVDVNGNPIPYNLETSSNLYVENLGKAIIDYRLRKFVLLFKEDNLISTKYLLSFALSNPNSISIPEKNLLLDQFLNSINMFYA